MKLRFLGLVLAGMLLLCACSMPREAPPSAPSPPVAQSLPAPASATPPEEAGPDLPPLVVESAEGLSGEPQNWWFGTQRGEDNAPLPCTEKQALYGHLGLVALGPDPGAIYLTFDFGYETGYAEAILDTLQEKAAGATFFLTLNYPQQNPGTAARMVAEGHSVGGHSATHPGAPAGLTGLAPEEMRAEIAAVADYLREEYGYESRLFRFPEGIYSEYALAEAAGLGQYSVFWGYGYRDYAPQDQPPLEESLQKALDAAHPGAVYLLHPQKTNADMLPRLIDGLRAAGYRVLAL